MFSDVGVSDSGLGNASTGFGRELDDVVGHHDGAECRGPRACIAVSKGAVDTHQLDSVTRFGLVDQVIVQDDIDTARQLTGRGSLGHFLDRNALVIHVCRVTILSDKLGTISRASCLWC